MKKIIFVFLIAASLTACGNGGSETTSDSTSVTMDSTGTGGTGTTGGSGASGGGTMNTDTSGMGNAR